MNDKDFIKALKELSIWDVLKYCLVPIKIQCDNKVIKAKSDLLNMSIEEFADQCNPFLTVRVVNILRAEGIKNVFDIVSFPKDLLNTPMCGNKSLKEINYALSSVGLKLKMTTEEIDRYKLIL